MVVAPAGTTATWLNAGLTTSPPGCKRAISMGPRLHYPLTEATPLRSSGAPPRCSDAMPAEACLLPRYRHGCVLSALVRGGSAGQPATGAGQSGRLPPGAAESGDAGYRH